MNTYFDILIILGVQDLVATQFIPEGEEIFISYLPAMAEGSAPCKIRQEYVKEWYGFSCLCKQCCIKVNQRGLNRWSNNSEQKLGFLSKVKILKNAFNKK